MRLAWSFLLLLVATPSWGNPPESILGVWHLDLVRTMSEHFRRLQAAQPDSSVDDATRLGLISRSDIADQPPSVTITINDSEIVSSGPDSSVSISPYRIIGGNSGLVIIEVIDDEGHPVVTNIRLLDGAIAIASMDCEEDPDRCERARRRALAERDDQRVNQTVNEASAGSSIVASRWCATADAVDVQPERGESRLSEGSNVIVQPAWFYFVRAD